MKYDRKELISNIYIYKGIINIAKSSTMEPYLSIYKMVSGFLLICILFLVMCLSGGCMWKEVLQRPEESDESPENDVNRSFEKLEVGARNENQVLCKSCIWYLVLLSFLHTRL